MKHSKKWGVHSFQIDCQAFTSSQCVLKPDMAKQFNTRVQFQNGKFQNIVQGEEQANEEEKRDKMTQSKTS